MLANDDFAVLVSNQLTSSNTQQFDHAFTCTDTFTKVSLVAPAVAFKQRGLPSAQIPLS